jgi:hypothetical protein
MLDESDVRASMLFISKSPVFQYIVTLLTGKALPNQQSLINSSTAIQFGSTIGFVVAGVTGSILVYGYLPIYLYFLLLPTWLFTIAGTRKFQTEIHHQISHFRFSGIDLVDRILSDIFTPIFFTQDYVAYKREHQKHHTNELATPKDPDASFLYFLGFRPGMTKQQLWRQFFITMISPKFHLTFLYFRVKANFVTAPLHRIALSVACMAFLLSLIVVYGFVTVFVVWIFPMVFLYQIASICQFLTEHRWFQLKDVNDTGKQHLAKLTVGRFFGEAYAQHGGFRAKAIWALRMVLCHGVARLFVCQGTLPAHDAHHRMAGSKEWPNLIFVRQRDIDTGCKGWEPYTETWGFFNMLDQTFEQLSNLSPIEENEKVNVQNEVLGM